MKAYYLCAEHGLVLHQNSKVTLTQKSRNRVFNDPSGGKSRHFNTILVGNLA
jgi:hypothetical protein